MLEKISECIYYMEHEEEIDRPALGLIVGKTGCMVIDAGDSKEHALLMQEEIKKMNLPPVKYVVLTHRHKDHIGGTNYWTGSIVSSKKTSEMIIKDFGEEERGNLCIDILFEGSLEIEIGDCKCYISEIENPHREDGTIVYVEKEKILFVGDAAYGRGKNGHNYFERELVNKMMSCLESYEFDYMLCSHESICSKEEMVSYWNSIKMGAEITLNCNSMEDALVKFNEVYGRIPSKDEIYYIQSFFM